MPLPCFLTDREMISSLPFSALLDTVNAIHFILPGSVASFLMFMPIISQASGMATIRGTFLEIVIMMKVMQVRMLLVEDNFDDAALIREMLKEAKCMVFETTRVVYLAEALERLKSDVFDVILLDLRLPDSDGFDTYQRVNMLAPDIPVVVFTGLADVALGVKAVKAGAQDYLIKGQVEGYLLAKTISYAIEHSQVERTLRLERGLFAGGPVVVFKWSATEGWPVEYVSPNIDQFGYSPEDFISGRIRYSTIIHPWDLERIAGEITAYSQSGIPYFEQEYRIVDANGHCRWVYDFTTVNRSHQGAITHYHGYVLDITVRKQMEEDLLKARKLEATGIMAGGIAHDFNNLLTTILGNIDMACEDAGSGRDLLPVLTDAKKALHLTIDLTKRFLTIATGGAPPKCCPTSIEEVVKDATRLALSGSNVECEYFFPDDLWEVDVDRAQMSHVIVNLMLNAKEAMPEGGIIRIMAENADIESTDMKNSPSAGEGRYLRISIRDQGAGIPERNLARVFDPYFSTKERGSQKGMGLGLTIAHSIIHKHGGRIDVKSEVGIGTLVNIYLPACGAKS